MNNLKKCAKAILIEKELLELLIPSILGIDGGCSYCIRNFCADVNEELERHKIKLSYVYSDSVSFDDRVKVFEIIDD